MHNQAKKLVLSKDTLRNLDDQNRLGIVGGTGTIVCIETAVWRSGVCNSVVCCAHSLVCL